MARRAARKQEDKPNCIRSYQSEVCSGHTCVACGRMFFCGERHVCTPRPERTQIGIERTLSMAERLRIGFAMNDDDSPIWK